MQNLLRFSEKGFGGRGKVAINEVLREVLTLMTEAFEKSEVALELQLEEDLPAISADAGQLSLVAINILTNAKNAIEQGGKISIESRTAGEGIEITFRDNGKGIPKEQLERIFDPFFTTKSEWTGAGMGLAVAYRIVQDHGGRIEAQSKVGEGTRMRVWLPLRAPEPTFEAPLSRRAAVMLE